jgi:CheY-like chemotaxis protein
MDLKMPVMDGYEATREIRKINSEVPIIAQTAYALSGDSKKAMDAGCNEYVIKPINKEELLEKLKRNLGD